jgi:DNA glycosylase AlkZ-like
MDLRAARVTSQLLDGDGERSPAAIVRRLLAVQAQDPVAARLALRARGAKLAADVDRALEKRELVAAWLCRGTLHLVEPQDHGWLLALTAPGRFASSRRRLGQLGVSEDDADRAVGIIERALADEGPLTRPELAERIAAKGIPTEGQATPHLLGLAALRGVTVLGPPASSTPRDSTQPTTAQAFVLARDWIGEPPAVDRDAALAELARRYLTGHGPATPADLAAWSGLPLRDVRAGLGAIDVVEEGDLVDLPGRKAPGEPPPRLLGAFDPYLLGWKDRSFAVPAKHAKRVHPGGGILRAVALLDGRAVGTWGARRRDGRLDLTLEMFGRAPRAAFESEMDDVARFEGRARG